MMACFGKALDDTWAMVKEKGLRERIARRCCTAQRPACRSIVRFVGIGKTYDGITRVVDDLDLDIERGEFLTLLGPSGSGKTTTLMMLAGFETPTAGEILLEGKPLSQLPPHKREIGMVFQNYALFPHMTVAENIGFPLSVRGIARAEIAHARRARARHGAARRLRRRAGRRSFPAASSSAIAVARALVFEPKLVLMDEPLGALDKQLREQMQLEIRRLHQRLGVTMVYVTHDQSEALTMSDRIAVFHRGKIQQLDAPEQHLRDTRRTPSSPASSARTTASTASASRVDGTRCTVRHRRRRVHRRLARRAAAGRRRGHGLAAAGAGANLARRAYNPGERPDAGSRARCAKSSISAITSGRASRCRATTISWSSGRSTRRTSCRRSATPSNWRGRPSIAGRSRGKS